MLCSKCGAENPQDVKFCSKCGAELGVSVAPVGTPPSVKAEKTWKPTTAGILSIIAGAISVIVGLVVAAVGTAVGGLAGMFGLIGLGAVIAAIAAVPVILGIVAIVGGIYALRRKVWGLALAGSICSLFGPWIILGILAIIFVSMGKGEFK